MWNRFPLTGRGLFSCLGASLTIVPLALVAASCSSDSNENNPGGSGGNSPGVGGAIGSGGSGGGCAVGLVSCNGACVNTASDAKNCGTCNNACAASAPLCSASACVATCGAGQMTCGTGCVDPASFQTDASNCGSCGNACTAGQACTAGACTATGAGGAGAGGAGAGGSSGGTAGTGTGGSGGGTAGAGAGGAAPRPGGCAAAPELLSDFEEGTGVLVQQGGRTGYWYTFADMVANGKQTPATASKGIAVALIDPPGGDCKKYALHTTASGHPEYVGVGATFAPNGMMKSAVDLSAYTGISFRIRSGSGTAPPIMFEMLTKESQPTTAGGIATVASVDLYNSRTRMLEGVGTDWKTFTIPFNTMGPRYLPGDMCTSTAVLCEAPVFKATSALGLQFALYDQITKVGAYDLWIDDVTLTKGDAGAPTYTQGTANFPFPVDKPMTNGCVKPTGASGKLLIEAYQRWKTTFVVAEGSTLRVKRPEANNDTVSEGIGYGMLIAVYMNDRSLFDGLWAYWKSKPSGNSLLMNWQIPGGSGSATDADEDAAFALIQASRQWGGSYLDDAKAIIAQIRQADVESGSNALKPGNQFGGAGLTNPSYFAPAYYREFAKVDTAGASTWNAVIASTYQFLNAIEGSNGLVPAWCSNNCTTRGGGSYADNDKYQYDSHRTPWRMALDVCWNNNADAKDYVIKSTKFFVSQVGTVGFGKLADLWQGNGTACGGCSQAAKRNSMSIIGTATAGSMATGDASHKAFLDRGWQFLLDANYTVDPTVRSGPTSAYTYYNATVGLLSALTLSGNFNNF